MSIRTRFKLGAVVLLLGISAGAANAQYKVIGPDGKVTYTDRAPKPETGKVSPLGVRDVPAPAVVLPAELAQAVSRYPVVLYVSAPPCSSCDNARQWLRERGIPHTEKQVLTGADGVAFERLTGGRDVPALTIGAQTLRGLAPEVWASYLDAAGYPRESRLPAAYEYPAPTPLTQRQEGLASRGNAPGAAGTAFAPPVSVPAPPPPPASGIRF
jgi:hypothetical protein